MVKKADKAAKRQKKAKKKRAMKKVMLVGDQLAIKPPTLPTQREIPPDDDESDVSASEDENEQIEVEKSTVHAQKRALRGQVKQTKLERLSLSKRNPEERKKKKALTKVFKALKEQVKSGISRDVADLSATLERSGIEPKSEGLALETPTFTFTAPIQ